LAYPLQPRPAPGRPSADLQHKGGQNWIAKRGQYSVLIDNFRNQAEQDAQQHPAPFVLVLDGAIGRYYYTLSSTAVNVGE
jgi:hypothetical protein